MNIVINIKTKNKYKIRKMELVRLNHTNQLDKANLTQINYKLTFENL